MPEKHDFSVTTQAATEIDRAKQARSKAEEQVTPGSPTEVRPGGANNPTGRNQHSDKPEQDVEVKPSITRIDQTGKPNGCVDAPGILRRLSRAAKGIKSHGVEPSPELQVLCAELLDRFERGEISANQAAIEAGFRKKRTDLESAIWYFQRLSADDRTKFMELAESMSGRIIRAQKN